MPSTSFENSAMKSSFSLSSLHTTPGDKTTRPAEFNSLKKKRKESLKRLSWGSSASEQQTDFWSPALAANYNYIMDNQLIDNCQDANCELSVGSHTWSLDEFNAQFSVLYSWLDRIQEKIYGNEDNVTNKTLRSHCKGKLTKKRPFYNIFKEQGGQLMMRYSLSEAKNEVKWRLGRLSSKWDALESVLKTSDSEKDDTIDVQAEVKALKNWIIDMDERLQPLSFKRRWSKTEIETIANEYKVLHKDIENHGKIVNSIVKLCERTPNCSLSNVTALERRWHLLFLRSMEWQCYIETYIRRRSAVLLSDSDSDEGPVKKQPRLTNNDAQDETLTSEKNDHDIDAIDGRCKLDDELSLNHGNAIMNALQNGNNYVECDSTTAIVVPRTKKSSQQLAKIKSARNSGTYYFKHIDTDSDMEKLDHLQNISLDNDQYAEQTSDVSEEEWTYTTMTNKLSEDDSVRNNNKLVDIRQIVQEVEELVSPLNRPATDKTSMKMMRIKQWLEIDKSEGQQEDSCDASSEDDASSTESSEEQNESIATYRAQASLNASSIDLGHAASAMSTPKVVLRQKYGARGMKDKRPNSVSCITQLSQQNVMEHDGQTGYSISESALHQLPLGGNHSSSTVDDSSAMINDETNSPMRRKRFKSKKKNNIRKFEMSTPYNGSFCRERTGTLVKSGSFSGRLACKQTTSDRHTASDPSSHPIGHGGFETSTTSGADSDDDKRIRRVPLFKVGSVVRPLRDIRDESPGQFTNEEPLSSLCEDAWDNYQEKYSSEAYSEAHDSDAARRLLDFGEDYRNFLGSQSDWSAQSSQFEFSPQFPRKAYIPMSGIDSDSEASSLRQLLKDSRSQLAYTENMFEQQRELGRNQFLVNNDMVELNATCDRHISCLSPVEKSPEEYTLSTTDRREFSDLISRWQSLKSRISTMQEYRNLQNEILQVKRTLLAVQIPNSIESVTVNTLEDLSRDIDFYNAELANIEEHKKKLLKVNVAVNHFTTEHADYAASSLKADVSELYRICYEIKNSASDRVTRLNVLLQNWQMLETRLDQLRGDLRDDEQSLGALDIALQGGQFNNQMVTSARVAKLLSEAKSDGCTFSEILTEGSFSDSGISDEGSEHDVGERERRLTAIRRLVRQLEVVMAPDSDARVRMRERLAAAEEELRTLQHKCRSIIVRTAVSTTTPLSDSVVVAGTGGDPDDSPRPSSWFKRVMRASTSFQIALLALLFLACWLEPHCCDNMNNLNLSLSPQLHYVRGPPPI